MNWLNDFLPNDGSKFVAALFGFAIFGISAGVYAHRLNLAHDEHLILMKNCLEEIRDSDCGKVIGYRKSF